MLGFFLLILTRLSELAPLALPDWAWLPAAAFFPFVLGNMLPPAEPEGKDPPEGGEDPGPSQDAALEALKVIKDTKADSEETFKTEADRKAEAEAAAQAAAKAAEKTKPAEGAPAGDEFLKEAKLEGHFKDSKEALKSYGELYPILQKVAERFKTDNPLDILNFLMTFQPEAVSPAAAPAKEPAKKEPEAPAELTPDEKVFLSEHKDELGYTEDSYKKIKGFIVASILADPKVKAALVADVLPKVQLLEKATLKQMQDNQYNAFLAKFAALKNPDGSEKYPQIKEIPRAKLEAHLQAYPEIADLAVRRGQNEHELAFIDIINHGGLVELLENVKRDAQEKGAEAANRLKKAEFASRQPASQKETSGKTIANPEEEDDPEKILADAGMTKQDGENWLLGK